MSPALPTRCLSPGGRSAHRRADDRRSKRLTGVVVAIEQGWEGKNVFDAETAFSDALDFAATTLREAD
jgi:hypothetical protein